MGSMKKKQNLTIKVYYRKFFGHVSSDPSQLMSGRALLSFLSSKVWRFGGVSILIRYLNHISLYIVSFLFLEEQLEFYLLQLSSGWLTLLWHEWMQTCLNAVQIAEQKEFACALYFTGFT